MDRKFECFAKQRDTDNSLLFYCFACDHVKAFELMQSYLAQFNVLFDVVSVRLVDYEV